MKIKLEEYIRESGGNPYQTWFDSLNAQAAAKVMVAKTRLELGNDQKKGTLPFNQREASPFRAGVAGGVKP